MVYLKTTGASTVGRISNNKNNTTGAIRITKTTAKTTIYVKNNNINDKNSNKNSNDSNNNNNSNNNDKKSNNSNGDYDNSNNNSNNTNSTPAYKVIPARIDCLERRIS